MLVSLVLLQLLATTPGPLGTVTPGPHAVGFSQRWLIDSTRRLPGGKSEWPAYRPVLLNLWYPTDTRRGATMRYRDYFDGAERAATPGTKLAAYAKALIDYQRGVAVSELVSAPRDSLPPAVRARLDALFNGSTTVRRDAPRKRGEWPVVFYQSGAGSSYDDNIVLIELLASHGYLVVGSAFPREDNSDFGTSLRDDSRQRDHRRLLLELQRLPGITLGPVIAIGHSLGAQAMLAYVSDPSATIDAVLALDTTQDYVTLADNTWAYFTDRAVEFRADIRKPIVFAAGPEALFELADSLKVAPRWLVTAPHLDHNDFISQGVLSREIVRDDTVAMASARRGYEALNRYIVDWVADFVRNGTAMNGPTALAPLHVAHAAPGSDVPAHSVGQPPTARVVRHLFSSGDAQFMTAFTAMRATMEADEAVGVLTMLLTGAIARNDTARALGTLRQVHQADSTLSAAVLARVDGRAKLWARIQAKDLAATWRRYHEVMVGAAGR